MLRYAGGAGRVSSAWLVAHDEERRCLTVDVGLYLDLRNPPQWERPWVDFYGQVLERLQAAEELGIGSVWLTEHHLFEDGYLPQPLTFAAAIAARTTRMRIGTAVLLAPLRSAIDLAEQAAIVDLLSGGRLELGLGAGYRAAEFELFGKHVSQRYALLEACATEVKRLWEEGGFTPRPLQAQAPLWIGAHGPRAGRLAGRLNAGMLTVSRKAHQPYRDALHDGGHGADQARLTVPANLILSDDPEAAWRRIKPHLAYQWGSYVRYGAQGEDGSSGTLGAASLANIGHDVDPDTLRSAGPRMIPPAFDVVTPDEAVGRIRTWLGEMPVRTVLFWSSIAGMPDDLVDRHVELLANDVAPELADVGMRSGAA